MQGWPLENSENEFGNVWTDEDTCLTVKSTLPTSPEVKTKMESAYLGKHVPSQEISDTFDNLKVATLNQNPFFLN
jgi:hypothetical protein